MLGSVNGWLLGRSGDYKRLTLSLLVVGAFAFALLYFVMAFGPGVSPDSIIYIDTAKNLVAGHGFYAQGKPMTHYPPGYPLLLAAISSSPSHSDILQGARLLDAFLYAANAILFALSVHICTRQSRAATICALLVYFSSPSILSLHSMAWSEPPFLTFSLVSILCISLYATAPPPASLAQTRLLLIASGSLSCAILTRYVGITLLPPVLLGLFLAKLPIRRKIRDAFIAICVSCIPMGIWLVHNKIVAHTSTNRVLAFHPAGMNQVRDLILTFATFVFWTGHIPHRAKAVLFAMLVALLFLGLWILHRRKYLAENIRTIGMILPLIGGCFVLVYVAFLFVSISLFDAATPLDQRLLLPAFLFLTLAVIPVTLSLSKCLQKPIVWRVFVGCTLLSVSFNGIQAARSASRIHAEGEGYSSREWNDSPTVMFVKAISDPNMKIYSNGNDVINFATGLDGIQIPRLWNILTTQQNQDYEEQLREICQECLDGRAVIICFNARDFLPTEEQMNLSDKGLTALKQMPDGTVYGRRGLEIVRADLGTGSPE